MTASQLSSKDQKPLWQEWPGRPVPLRKTQLGCRALASLFELAAIIYFTWLCSNWQGRFITAAAGFSTILVGFLLDMYEAYILASHERDFPINPGAICIDLLVITVGFIGYWLIAVVDHKSKNPDSPALNDTLGRAGVVVLVTLTIHGLFLLFGIVGVYISSRAQRQQNDGNKLRAETHDEQLADLP